MALPVSLPGDPAREGVLEALEGDRGTLRLPVAFAPGAPFRLSITLATGALDVQAKTFGSRRDPDGRFVVTVRFIAMTREARATLAAAFAPTPP